MNNIKSLRLKYRKKSIDDEEAYRMLLDDAWEELHDVLVQEGYRYYIPYKLSGPRGVVFDLGVYQDKLSVEKYEIPNRHLSEHLEALVGGFYSHSASQDREIVKMMLERVEQLAERMGVRTYIPRDLKEIGEII